MFRDFETVLSINSKDEDVKKHFQLAMEYSMVSAKRSLKERNKTFVKQKEVFIAYGTYFTKIVKGIDEADIESLRQETILEISSLCKSCV